jgi:hypothetical protein
MSHRGEQEKIALRILLQIIIGGMTYLVQANVHLFAKKVKQIIWFYFSNCCRNAKVFYLACMKIPKSNVSLCFNFFEKLFLV